MSVLRFSTEATAANGTGAKTNLNEATIVYCHSTAADQTVTIYTTATNNAAGNVVIASFTIGDEGTLVFSKERTHGVAAGSANVKFSGVASVGG